MSPSLENEIVISVFAFYKKKHYFPHFSGIVKSFLIKKNKINFVLFSYLAKKFKKHIYILLIFLIL